MEQANRQELDVIGFIKGPQMGSEKKPIKPIILTSHPARDEALLHPIHWGAPTAHERGPIVGGIADSHHRNCIGTHSGSYSVYRALAVASGALKSDHIPDLTDTRPVVSVGPFDSWKNSQRIISIDPWGAEVDRHFSHLSSSGVHAQPTIAITQAHISIPEIVTLVDNKKIRADGCVIQEDGDCFVTKAAIEPVWYLPAIAQRFKIEESDLRRGLFEQTAGMFPELITRPDLSVLLPPIGGHTVYFFGDPELIRDPSKEVTVRVHDECNGSDVFGSDICTCRPYLIHGIEECILTAQDGGIGIIVYNRKEGRALGEVTKFLVYNARKRQEGGDTADKYFHRTECVAGVQDMRFQELMPDVLHWIGITKIDRFVSMSDMKYDAITNSGIQILKRVSIPADRIPADAHVEIQAKRAAGYFVEEAKPTKKELTTVKGRSMSIKK